MAAMISKEATEELIHSAFDLCPSGLIVVDRFGRMSVVNRAVERLFGYSRQELIGEPMERLTPGWACASHATSGMSDGATVATPVGEVRARHKDGGEFPVKVELSSISALGSAYTFATVDDVSARHRAEARLHHVGRLEAIGTMASGAVHGLKNILHCILAFSELAAKTASGEPSASGSLDTVVVAARRGQQLCDRILCFARKTAVVRTRASFGLAVREAIHLLRPALPANIEIRESLAEDTSLVLADTCELHQIVVSLMINAAHSMQEGGVLDVRLEPTVVALLSLIDSSAVRTAPGVRLSISDTGTGIPPEVLDHIFEPFFTTKSPGQGTGLGLAVTNGIVRSLGGRIEVGTTLGKGTRFDVYLPAVSLEGSSAETPTESLGLALERR